jgi:hypothetical protein
LSRDGAFFSSAYVSVRKITVPAMTAPEGKTVVVILLSEGRILKAGAAEEVLRSREPEDAFGVTPGFFEAEDGLHIYVKEARLDNPSGLW